MSIQLWDNGAHGGVGSHAPHRRHQPLHHEEQVLQVIFLAWGRGRCRGGGLCISVRLIFIKLNRISTAFLSWEGKSINKLGVEMRLIHFGLVQPALQ